MDMSKLKILVVDDEARMRKLVKDFLVRKDYKVIEAADGEEAIDLFVEHNDFDLIILDVMMPKMDGWEVYREIRKFSKIPIIMLTAKSEESDELLGFELGVDEYISKPFSTKDFWWQELTQFLEELTRLTKMKLSRQEILKLIRLHI